MIQSKHVQGLLAAATTAFVMLSSQSALAHHHGEHADRPVTQKGVLSCIHHADQMEIQMGQLAQRNGLSQSVRDYGALLVKDHTAAEAKVTEVAREEGITVKDEAMSDDEVSTQNRLSTLTGAQFDQAFMSQMAADHKEVIGELDHALGQLPSSSRTRSLVSALLPTLRAHRHKAKMITAQLNPSSERLPASDSSSNND